MEIYKFGSPYCLAKYGSKVVDPVIGDHNGETLRAGMPKLTLGPVMLPVWMGTWVEGSFPSSTTKDRVVKKTSSD